MVTMIITHTLHGAGIFIYIWVIFRVNVGWFFQRFSLIPIVAGEIRISNS